MNDQDGMIAPLAASNGSGRHQGTSLSDKHLTDLLRLERDYLADRLQEGAQLVDQLRQRLEHLEEMERPAPPAPAPEPLPRRTDRPEAGTPMPDQLRQRLDRLEAGAPVPDQLWQGLDRLEQIALLLSGLEQRIAHVEATASERLQAIAWVAEQALATSQASARRPGAVELPRPLRGLRWLRAQLLPGRRAAMRRMREDYRVIAGSVLFDAGWYHATYPDVAAAGVDPAYHYLRFGADERRNPGPRFDTRSYVARNPAIAASGMNPLVHFLRFGVFETRLVEPPDRAGRPVDTARRPAASGIVPVARARFRRRAVAPGGMEARLWFYIGDSIEWLSDHKRLTGVGRVSSELFLAASERTQGPAALPCVLDQAGGTLALADQAAVLAWLAEEERRGDGASPPAALAEGPQPGDHVFFTGLVWTPTFTGLFERLAQAGIRFSVLLHDIIPLEAPDSADTGQARDFAAWLACTLQNADNVFVSTAFVEGQVRRWALLNGIEIGAQIRRIAFGASAVPAEGSGTLAGSDPRLAALRRESFVLSVGTIDRRKNQVALCRIWQRLAAGTPGGSLPQLVLAGRDDLGLGDRRSVFADMIAAGQLLILEDLSDQDLAALYRSCLFTAFPSTREGYGLPVAESLMHGRLCLAADLPVIREHAGDLAWYFDPADEAASDALFARAIAEPEARRAAEAAIAAGFRPPRWAEAFERMVEYARQDAEGLADPIAPGAHRPDFPGMRRMPVPLVLAQAARWCTDRDPEVSILIINWNAASLTLECIRQIWAHTEGHTYEIVIADNGSGAEDLRRLRQLGPGIRVLQLDCNRFFGEANNIAAEAARGQLLCLLNNDAFVQPGWLTALVGALRSHPEAGAVGPLFLYPDGVVQEAGATVDAAGFPIRLGRGGSQDDPSIQVEKYADYISAAALLLPRALFLEVGGFDHAYEPAYYEDTDLCFRIQAFGRRVLYCPDARVIHIEGASANGDTVAEARRKALGDLNRDKFVRRWGRFLRDRDAASLSAARASFVPARWGMRGASPPAGKVAVLYTPYPLTAGGGERYLLTWAEILAEDHQVTLVTRQPYSALRLRNLAADFRLDLAGVQVVTEAAFRSLPQPDLMVAMGNEALPPIAPGGRVNFFHCQFPFGDRDGAGGPQDLRGYDAVVVNSGYTHDHYLAALARLGLRGTDVRVIHPPVPVVEAAEAERAPIILSVGRFFVGGHSKRQDLLIDAFGRLLAQSPQPIELHLAGSSTPQPEHMDYLAGLRAKAAGLPVHFHVNLDDASLTDLYRRAAVYWHGTGLGQDLRSHPEQAEHFGISVVEAMSGGAIPFALDAGGPREIIRHGESGFLYDSLDRLVEDTRRLFTATTPAQRAALSAGARRRASDFSAAIFRERVRALAAEFV